MSFLCLSPLENPEIFFNWLYITKLYVKMEKFEPINWRQALGFQKLYCTITLVNLNIFLENPLIVISLVQIRAILTKLTIQKQPATCDLTKDFTKLGYSGGRFDRTSWAWISADDLAPPSPSTAALPFIELQVKHSTEPGLSQSISTKCKHKSLKHIKIKHLRHLTDLIIVFIAWLVTACSAFTKFSN